MGLKGWDYTHYSTNAPTNLEYDVEWSNSLHNKDIL